MLFWISVLFLNDNTSSKNIWRNLEKFTLYKNSLHNFWVAESYTISFCWEKENGMSEPPYPPFFSLRQSHSNQQCNWNATPFWRRKGNFWQGDVEHLGALFTLSTDSHSLWTQLSRKQHSILFLQLEFTLILLPGVLHIDKFLSDPKKKLLT